MLRNFEICNMLTNFAMVFGKQTVFFSQYFAFANQVVPSTCLYCLAFAKGHLLERLKWGYLKSAIPLQHVYTYCFFFL